MIKVEDRSSVQVLHHQEITIVGPILYLYLALCCLLHSIHKHASKVLTLSSEDSLVTVYRLLLHEEDNICKCGIVDDGSHISYQAIDGLVIDFVFFKFADVKDTDIIQPLTAVKTSEDEKLLGTYNTCSMPLSSCRCFLKFQRMAPSHRLCIEYIQIIRWNNLLK
jgi:hypothetical protein